MKYLVLTAFLLGVVILDGCKVPKEAAIPDGVATPHSFKGDADSSSVADIPRSQFFKDPYLVALIDTALQQNADLMIAVQRIEVARSYFKASKGAQFPTLDVKATVSGDRYGDYTLEGVGNADLSPNLPESKKPPYPVVPNYFLGVTSSWEVDIWGKLRNKKRAAYARLLATESGRDLVATSLIAEIAYRYYELLALDNELEIVRKNIALQQKALDIIIIQKENGRATELAVKQFSAQLMRTKNLEIEARQHIIRTQNELNYFTGSFSQQVTRNDSFAILLPTYVSAGLPSAMLRRRPDIVQAEQQMKAAKLDVAAARASFYPSLMLTPYTGFNSFNAAYFFDPGSFVYGITGGLTAPVFNQNQIRSNYNRSLAEGKTAYYEYQKTVIRAFNEVVTELNAIDNERKSYDLYISESQELTSAVDISNDLYLAGYASYLEVITAQRNALEAELNVIHTKRNLQFSLIDLYRSTGGGWK